MLSGKTKKMKLKVAVLQLSPQLGAVKANIERANAILRAHGFLSPLSTPTSTATTTAEDKPQKQRELDVLVLPELAFTGYNFKSPAEIEPFLEPTAAGVSTQWAQATSKAVGCHTLVGYPETAFIGSQDNGKKDKKTYNSAVMVDPTGNVLFNYRKTFLYETDETWGCSEPPVNNFASGTPFPLTGSIMVRGKQLRTQVGICMDLNPYKFTESPFDAYEFGTAAFKHKAHLVLLPTAWLHPQSPDIVAKRLEAEAETETSDSSSNNSASIPFDPESTKKGLLSTLHQHLNSADGAAPDLSTVNYWASRMLPFLQSDDDEPERHPVGMLICNRAGIEDWTGYAGSSTIFTLNTESKTNSVGVGYHGSLGQAGEELLYAEIEVDERY